MISLQFENLDELTYELNQKYEGIGEIISGRSKTEISKAIFTITTKKFIKDFAVVSAGQKNKYFHMYEWNEVGNPSKKLYKVNREAVSGGNLRIHISLIKSKTPVPIDPRLSNPGKRGKFVSKKIIFKDMAEVMESGKPVSFTTKQTIAFFSKSDNKIHFVSPNKLIVNSNPGGKKTTMAFEKFIDKWYATKVDSTIRSSGLFNEIGKSVAKALNNKKAGPTQARQAIRIVTEKYSQGVVRL